MTADFAATPPVFTSLGLFPFGSWLSSANFFLAPDVCEFLEHLVTFSKILRNYFRAGLRGEFNLNNRLSNLKSFNLQIRLVRFK